MPAPASKRQRTGDEGGSKEIPGLRQAEIPKVVHVRQTFPSEHLADVPAATAEALAQLWPQPGPLQGKSIGITVGSRGITAIDSITKAAVTFLRAAGAKPFIFPAMGSHGGGSAEGQTAMIAGYGVTEEAMGCPIIADMETSVLGVFDGVEVHCGAPATCPLLICLLDTDMADAHPSAKVAFDCDGILLMNRIKPHTDICKPPNPAVVGFDVGGIIGSGLSKICAIGAGKLEGAKAYHNHVLELGLETAVVVATRELIKAGKVAGGLAIIENAYHQTAQLESVAVDPANPKVFFEHEVRLHAKAKALMPALPIPLARWPPPVTLDPARPDALYDVLYCRDIGKDISGAGMDTNIIGRGAYETVPTTPPPIKNKICGSGHVDVSIRGLTGIHRMFAAQLVGSRSLIHRFVV